MWSSAAVAMTMSVAMTATFLSGPPGDESTAEALAAVEAVAPELESVVWLEGAADVAIAEVPADVGLSFDGAEVEVTAEGVGIELLFEGEGAEEASLPLEVSTPVQAAGDAALAVQNGTAVSESTATGLSQVTEVTESGVRMTSVAADAEALDALDYTFDDYVLFEARDGSVDIGYSPEGGVALIVGHVEAPWAADANGVPLETHYTIEGSVLTQHVEVDADTAFPVAADPYLVWTNNSGNFEIRWTRSETLSLARNTWWTAAGFAAVCAGPLAWHWTYTVLYASCFSAFGQFVLAAKVQARYSNGCLKVNGDISPFWMLGPLPRTCVGGR